MLCMLRSCQLYYTAVSRHFEGQTLALFLTFNFFFGKPEFLAVPEMQGHLAFDMQDNFR